MSTRARYVLRAHDAWSALTGVAESRGVAASGADCAPARTGPARILKRYANTVGRRIELKFVAA